MKTSGGIGRLFTVIQGRHFTKMLRVLACVTVGFPWLAQAQYVAEPNGERSPLSSLYESDGGADWLDQTGWLGVIGTAWVDLPGLLPAVNTFPIELYSLNYHTTLPDNRDLYHLSISTTAVGFEFKLNSDGKGFL